MNLVPLQIKATSFIDTVLDFVGDPKKNSIYFALVLALGLKECSVWGRRVGREQEEGADVCIMEDRADR